MRISILGAGIAGLAAAHAIRNEGARLGEAAELIVYEAGPRAGGRIRSTRDADYLIEGAANGFQANADQALALVSDLGLAPERVTAPAAAARRYVYADPTSCKCLYVGGEEQYQLLRRHEQQAVDRLLAGEGSGDTMDWGLWGIGPR